MQLISVDQGDATHFQICTVFYLLVGCPFCLIQAVEVGDSMPMG